MDYHRLTIGQMAELNHISRQMLRHYDAEGLLVPAVVDESTGYRYYNIRQNARLNMIQYMKSMGISLREIKEYIDGRNTSEIVRLLDEKQSDIDSEIVGLQQQKKAIRRMVESIQRYESAPPDGAIVLEYIGSRTIYSMDTETNLYSGGIEVYEQMLHQLKERMRDHALPEIYYFNAGTILRKDRLIARDFYSTEAFVFVDKNYEAQDLLTRLPPGTYYCIYCKSFDNEQEYATRLLEYVEECGLQITGDYLCEVLFEPPVSSHAQRDMLMRLQVPVRFCE